MPEAANTLHTEWIQGLLVFVSLLCCVGCLYMVFFFGRQIQTAAYLRASLVAAVRAQELQNLMRELQARRLTGPLDEKYPPPKDFEWEAKSLWRDDMAVASAAETAPYIASDVAPEQRQAIEDRFRQQQEERVRKEQERRAPFEKWAKDERERYANLCEKAERDALQAAEDRVPKTMDISLLGGGWSFLLEFSTVIVILFILLCLGILNALTGKDSVTILASIAGYVLGKASASVQRGQGPQHPGSPPSLQNSNAVS